MIEAGLSSLLSRWTNAFADTDSDGMNILKWIHFQANIIRWNLREEGIEKISSLDTGPLSLGFAFFEIHKAAGNEAWHQATGKRLQCTPEALIDRIIAAKVSSDYHLLPNLILFSITPSGFGAFPISLTQRGWTRRYGPFYPGFTPPLPLHDVCVRGELLPTGTVTLPHMTNAGAHMLVMQLSGQVLWICFPRKARHASIIDRWLVPSGGSSTILADLLKTIPEDVSVTYIEDSKYVMLEPFECCIRLVFDAAVCLVAPLYFANQAEDVFKEIRSIIGEISPCRNKDDHGRLQTALCSAIQDYEASLGNFLTEDSLHAARQLCADVQAWTFVSSTE